MSLRATLVALLIALASLVPVNAPARTELPDVPTIESLNCQWGGPRSLTLLITTTLSVNPPDGMTITYSSDHPEILWTNTGGTLTENLPDFTNVIEFRLYPDWITVPAVDTAATITVSVGTSAATCDVVVTPEVPPIPALASFTCRPEIENGLECWASLAEPLPFFFVVVTLSTDHPEILPYFTTGFENWTFTWGGQDGYAYNNTNAVRPERDTIVTVTASIDGSNSVSQQFLVRGLIPTETPTTQPTVTGTPPTATPTRTPSPTRTPTPIVQPGLRVLHTQVSSRAGNATKVTVCLDRRAPTGATVVNLASDNPGLIPVPATVTVPAGSGCLSVVAAVAPFDGTTIVQFTASIGAQQVDGSTRVLPSRPSIHAQTVSRAGGLSKVTVCQVSVAGDGGSAVPLTSSDPALFPLRAAAQIPAGKQCLSLIVSVGDTPEPVTVTVTADFNGTIRTAQTIIRRL